MESLAVRGEYFLWSGDHTLHLFCYTFARGKLEPLDLVSGLGIFLGD